MINKLLGQHFLINSALAKKIVTQLEIGEGDVVIEVGPGPGALTDLLLRDCQDKKAKLIAVEKDRHLALELFEKHKTDPVVEIIAGDILTELGKLSTKYPQFKLVGNLPYYLSGRILRILSELENKPSVAVFTFQKEVAERICAAKGKSSLLSSATQFWADAQILFYIPNTDFDPPPKVESAAVLLTTKTPQPEGSESFYNLISAAFKQPRKTLLNNLSSAFPQLEKETILAALKQIKMDEKTRAQELSVEDLANLATLFH